MEKMKRVLSIILAFVLVVSGVPVVGVAVFAEENGTGNITTVVAFSDFQYENTDLYNVGATGNSGGRILLNRIVSASGITSADGLLCCGDYDYDLNRSAADTASGVETVKDVMSALVSEDSMVLAQGNHDPKSTEGGTADSGNNDPSTGAYGVYVINERDYMWNASGMSEQTVKETAEGLRRYLNNKIAVGYKPLSLLFHICRFITQ